MNEITPATPGSSRGSLPWRIRKAQVMDNSSNSRDGNPRMRGLRARLAAGLMAIAAAAAAAAILPMASASASTYYPTSSSPSAGCSLGVRGTGTPGDFSPYFPATNCRFDDCKVVIGAVYYPPNPYYVVGGVRIDCATRHTIVAAQVWEEYWNGTSWVRGPYASHSLSNWYGSNGIWYTPLNCAHADGLLWHTYALVQTERAGAWIYSAGNTTSGARVCP
jgi:hypothetical protein